MAAKFFALLTNQGAAKLSNMAALGEKLEITSLAVGDGGGISPTPNQAQTKLVNEVRRAQLNSLSVDEKNDSQIIAEQIIPESVGGWWIREIGLFDADGILIAVANCPETYKATTEEGSGRTQVIRMMLTVSSTDAVTLKVDPSVVLATRQYVDSAVIEVKTYTDNAMKKHVDAANPHSQYLLIENALKELAEAGLVGDVLKNLRIVDATTSQKGLVRLNGGVTNESNEEAATPGAVKIAYDAAMNAFNLAKTKYTADGATTAIAGLVQLVNSMGGSNALVMPQAAVTTAIQTYPSLGKGQTLQDLRGSRGVGVTYTNSTGFPIAVYVRITGGTSANLYAYVDGKEYGGGGATASQTSIATAFFIVPNNTNYRVDAAGVSTVLQAWTELR